MLIDPRLVQLGRSDEDGERVGRAVAQRESTGPRLSRRALLGGAGALLAGAAVGGWRLTSGGGEGATPADGTPDPAPDGLTEDALAARLGDVDPQDAWLAPPTGEPEERAAWSYRAAFPGGAAEVLLVVGAAGRYELRVAGTPVARGPGPFTSAEAVGDLIDLSAVLADLAEAEGDVAVEVVVVDPAMETPRSERPWDAQRRPLPGGHALFLGLADGRPWTPRGGWTVAPNTEWDLTTPRINHVQPWVEHRRDAALDDAPTPPAEATPGPVAPAPGPYPATRAVARQSALAPWVPGSTAERRHPRAVVRAGTAPPSRPPVTDLFPAVAGTAIDTAEVGVDALRGDGWEAAAGGRDVHLVVDLGQVWFGTPYAVVDAAPGATVDVAASEALDEAGRLLADDVDSRHAHRLAADRVWRWEPHGARYLHLAVRGGGERVRIREVGLATEPTPALEGTFACPDEVLTEVWEAGARTLAGGWGDLLAADAGREQRAWVGDLHVALRVARSLWWERSRVEGERFLRRVAQSQRPDGSLPKHAPGEAPDASTIPSYVLAWVLALAEHEAAYGDGLAAELAPARDRALAWFDRWRGEDGIVAGVDGWHFWDWTPRREGGVSLPYTAMRAQIDRAAGATPPVTPERAAEVFGQAGRPAWADQAGEPQTSQAANAHAVLAGLLAGEDARAALRDTLAAPRFFPQTIPSADAWPQMDLEREAVGAQPYQGAFVLEALGRVGLHAEALALIRERWGALAAQDPTLGELWQPTASRCHPWSAGPTAWLTQEVLGLRLDGPGTVTVAPAPVDLAWAEGSLPTAHGPVALRWERDGDRRRARLTVPEGASARVGDDVLPAGGHALEL
jgi:hypothetical protein